MVNHSLITLHPTTAGAPAIQMLETMREFACDLLHQQGEECAIRRRHADAYRAVLATMNNRIGQGDYTSWHAQFDSEAANMEVALQWLMKYDPAAAAQFASHLAPVWLSHGAIQHGSTWLERCRALDGLDPLLQATLSRDLGVFWNTTGRYAEVEAVLLPALAVFEAAARERDQVRICYMLANAAMQQNQGERAAGYLARCETWARAQPEQLNLSTILHKQAELLEEQGQYDAASNTVTAMLALDATQADPFRSTLAWTRQGFLALAQGMLIAAAAAAKQAHAQAAQLKTYYPGNWGDLHRLDGMLALAHGDILQARIKVGHALTIATTLTDVPRTIQALDSSVLVLAQPNTAPTAAALLGLEQRLRKHYAMPVPPSWQPQLAAVEAQLTMWLSPEQIDHWQCAGTAWSLEEAYQHLIASE